MELKKSPAEVRVGNLLNLRVSPLPTSPTPVTKTFYTHLSEMVASNLPENKVFQT